jgi:phage tail sheath protein FI
VNVRRLFLYIEESMYEGINWAVFEPNLLRALQRFALDRSGGEP